MGDQSSFIERMFATEPHGSGIPCRPGPSTGAEAGDAGQELEVVDRRPLVEWASPDQDITVAETVRTRIDHGFTNRAIVDALAAMTPSGLLDVSALPAALQNKLAANGDDTRLYLPSSTPLPTPVDRLSYVALETKAVALFAVVMAVVGIAGAIVGWPIAATLIAELTAVPLCGYWLYRTLRPRTGPHADADHAPHGSYTEEEDAALAQAVVDWPRLQRLRSYPNADVLVSEWNRRWPWAGEVGAPAAVWREPHLVGVAILLAMDIRSSKAWNSDVFDMHRVRIDLDALLRDIRVRAHRIWRAHANAVTTSTDFGLGAVRQRNAAIAEAAELAWDQLAAMVAELADYRNALPPINALVEEIDALNRSSRVVTDAAVDQLYIDAAASIEQRAVLADSRAELADLSENLAAQLAVLRGILEQPASSLPLAAAE